MIKNYIKTYFNIILYIMDNNMINNRLFVMSDLIVPTNELDSSIIPIPKLRRQTNQIYYRSYTDSSLHDNVDNIELMKELEEIQNLKKYIKENINNIQYKYDDKEDTIKFMSIWGINGVIQYSLHYYKLLCYEDAGGSACPNINSIPESIKDFVKSYKK